MTAVNHSGKSVVLVGAAISAGGVNVGSQSSKPASVSVAAEAFTAISDCMGSTSMFAASQGFALQAGSTLDGRRLDICSRLS